MSRQYYNVQTNNRFAQLNLDSDSEVILAEKPQGAVDKDSKAQENGTKGGAYNKRSGVGNAKNSNRQSNENSNRNVGKPDRKNQPAQFDYEASRDNRRKDRDVSDTRVERSTQRRQQGKREGQRTFDKRGGALKAKDDVNPKNQEMDADAAAVDAAVELDGEGTDSPIAQKVDDEPETQTVSQYLDSQKNDRFVNAEAEIVEKFDDLEKNIKEQGFKAINVDRDDNRNTTKAVVTKGLNKNLNTTDLTSLGNLPKMKVYGDNKDYRNNNRNSNNYYKRDSPASHPTIPKINNEDAYKNTDMFPTLE